MNNTSLGSIFALRRKSTPSLPILVLLRLLFFLLCMPFFVPVAAQQGEVKELPNPKRIKHKSYDTAYIEKFGSQMGIAPIIAIPNFEFRIQPKEDSLNHKSSFYQPYLRAAVGASFHYKAISLMFSFRGPSNPEQEAQFGKTNYTILRVRLGTRRIIYDAFYTYFGGFSDRNTASYDPQKLALKEYNKRSDLVLQYGKIKATYVFSHQKFSYKSSYNYTERQKKSKTTLLAVAHAYHLNVDSDSSFFNSGQREHYKKFQNMEHLNVTSVGIGPGVAVNLVKQKWFLSGGIYIIADWQHHTATEKNKTRISEGWRGALVGDAFLGMGYNGDKFYSGITVRGDRNAVSLPIIQARTTFNMWVLHIGYRFNPPPVVHKIYNWGPLRNYE